MSQHLIWVEHPDVDGRAQVPATALPHMDPHWTRVPDEVLEAEQQAAAKAGAEKAAARLVQTSADSPSTVKNARERATTKKEK